ncbi:MAG: yocK [Firmicutes bacterium]|nr:yocK [Bacillota bacterium]
MAEKKQLLEIVSRIEKTGLGDAMSDSVSELSMYDNHPADISDQLFERSKDLALRNNEHILLEKVEAALAKIKDGSYGVCNHCGKAINIKRLTALPSAILCMECQEESDKLDTTSRPAEEEVLAPPFHQNFLDNDESNSARFNGDDVLQAILKYGSSDSSQDLLRISDDDDGWLSSNDEHLNIIEDSDAILDDNHDFTEDLVDEKSNKSQRKNMKNK